MKKAAIKPNQAWTEPRAKKPRPIVWVGHEVSGDIDNNLAKIALICEKIQRSGKAQPLFPSFTSRRFQKKLTPEESLAQVTTFFESGCVHELWLYGPVISEDMKREIALARVYGIRVVGMSPKTRLALWAME